MPENNEVVIHLQTRPDESEARSLPWDYDGPGFWWYDPKAKKYVWEPNS